MPSKNVSFLVAVKEGEQAAVYGVPLIGPGPHSVAVEYDVETIEQSLAHEERGARRVKSLESEMTHFSNDKRVTLVDDAKLVAAAEKAKAKPAPVVDEGAPKSAGRPK